MKLVSSEPGPDGKVVIEMIGKELGFLSHLLFVLEHNWSGLDDPHDELEPGEAFFDEIKKSLLTILFESEGEDIENVTLDDL